MQPRIDATQEVTHVKDDSEHLDGDKDDITQMLSSDDQIQEMQPTEVCGLGSKEGRTFDGGSRFASISSSTAKTLEEKLEEASAVSQNLHKKISMYTMYVAVIPTVLMSVMYALLSVFLVSPDDVGHRGHWGTALPW